MSLFFLKHEVVRNDKLYVQPTDKLPDTLPQLTNQWDRDRVQSYTSGDYGKQNKTGLRLNKVLYSKNQHYELFKMNCRKNWNSEKGFNYDLINTKKYI